MDTRHCVIVFLCCMHVVTCNISLLNNGNIAAARFNNEMRAGGRKQVQAPECTLRKDRGDCNNSIKKYYFDESAGTCRKFNYTGCGGNLNNFLVEEKCNSRCVCSNPKDNGQGSRRITRYYFNVQSESCQSFNYRGSGGNANKFASLSQCQDVCERPALRQICTERPDVGTDCNNNSTVKFYYDKHCDCCRKFTYLGCGGNRNKFVTRRGCEKRCRENDGSTSATQTRPQKPARCFFQNSYGDCNGRQIRYFYDNRLNRCVPFTYSGCGGNANNFLTELMCKRSCQNASKRSVLDNTVKITDKSTPDLTSLLQNLQLQF